MSRGFGLRINVFVLAVWYVLLPFSGKLELFTFGGTTYDLSQLIGIGIIFFNSICLLFIDYRRIPTAIFFFSIFFVSYAGLLLLIGENFAQSVNVFVRIYSGFLLFFVFCGAKYDGKQRLIEQFLLFMGWYTAIYTIIQFFIYHIDPQLAIGVFTRDAFVSSYSTVRPQGPLLSAGGSASVLSLTFILILKKILNNEFRVMHCMLAIFMTIAFLMNMTRTYLFTLVVVFICTLMYYRMYKVIISIFVGSILLIAGSLAVVPPSHYFDRFKDVPGVADKNVKINQMMQGRGLLMEIIWNDFKEKNVYRKISGDGLYHTNKILSKYFSVPDASTHNDFLWLLSNMGIFGLVLYLLYYFLGVMSYHGNDKILFVGYFIGIMFVSGFGGETICITGHRFLQVILLSYFFNNMNNFNYIEN